MISLGLFLSGLVCWTVSTLSAGGGSVLIIAVVALMLRGHAIAPVITIASLIAGSARIVAFTRFIDWRVVRYYLPGGTAGAILGSWAFAHTSGRLLQVGIGLFLISTVWQYRTREQRPRFTMPLPWFVPVAFMSGLTSAIVGASGLLANPFYLAYGMTKERMLATRAVNSLGIQLVKIIGYLAFGVMNWDLVGHGTMVGAGAALAVWATRPWLHRLDPHVFRRLAVTVMVVAGALILWQQRIWILDQLSAVGW